MKRREFLTGLSAAGLLTLAPGLAASAAVRPFERLLILVELKGGNDGLNTVVPYTDANYSALRPQIGIRRDEVLQITEQLGFHPSLQAMLPLWQAHELALVQGLGYPQPNLSHFRSIEIWDTASNSDEYLAAIRQQRRQIEGRIGGLCGVGEMPLSNSLRPFMWSPG